MRSNEAEDGAIWLEDALTPACIYSVEIPTDSGRNGDVLRVLDVGGAWESATYLDERRFQPPFSYLAAFDHLFEACAPDAHVLLLGGGACSYPKWLLAHHPEARITVIEHDPTLIRAADGLFFLDEARERFDPQGERLKLEVADAASWLVRAAGRGWHYDAIINDVFSGDVVDGALLGTECLATARSLLASDGVYLVNTVTRAEGADSTATRTALNSLGGVFVHQWIIPCSDPDLSDEDNYLLIASDGEHEFSGTLTLSA